MSFGIKDKFHRIFVIKIACYSSRYLIKGFFYFSFKSKISSIYLYHREFFVYVNEHVNVHVIHVDNNNFVRILQEYVLVL